MFNCPVTGADLEVGQPAPGFAMQDQYLKTHSLEKYLGKWVVLYFYPKDDTPGCTTEACNFRDDIFKLRPWMRKCLASVSTAPKAMPALRKNTACRSVVVRCRR